MSLQAVPQNTVGFSQNNSLLSSNVVLWLIDKHLIGFFLVGNLVLSHDFFFVFERQQIQNVQLPWTAEE